MLQTKLRRLGLILTLAVAGPTAATAQDTKPLPIVESATTPVYPILPRQAHIQGEIKLRVLTDGKQSTDVDVLSGQPMLAEAAKANITTWRFEPHEPTTFETIFRYRLIPTKCDAKCNCTGNEKEQVIQRLPAEVEIISNEVRICERALDEVFAKMQIKLNGKTIDLPNKVTFRIKDRVIDVPIREGGFQVPSEVRGAKDVGISFTTGRIRISTIVTYGAKLWRPTLEVILEDSYFEYPPLKGSKARAACVFDFGDGTQMFDPSCRSETR